MTPSDAMAIQVEELVRHAGDARRARQEQCRSFISHLAPRLQGVRTRERELDRQTARRFNAFKYLREDELGLSLMIADLLDPNAEHGQGTSFLKAMLDILLPETSDSWPQWESLLHYRDWNPLVPELYDECEARGGPITTYVADKFLDIAARAIPAINEVERSESNPQH